MGRAKITWLMVAWLLLAVAVASTAFARSPATTVQLQAVRLAAAPEGTRLTLELSAKSVETLFRLHDPERIVIDLRDTRLASGVRMPAPAGLVSRLRVGPQPPHSLRLVAEVNASTRTRLLWAPSDGAHGYRLCLDLGDGTAVAAVGARAPVRPAHAPIETGRDVVVAVDAGHGGEDPGAIGHGGMREKDVVLGIARSLAASIDREPGMHAVLTRDGDYFIALRQRIARARAAKADLFVSIHADSVQDPAVAGASVYVLSEKGATNEAARWLAERENAADLKGGVKLDDKDNVLASVLLDLSQTASLGASTEAAERVLTSIDRIGEVRKPRVQQAGFVVLKSPDIPSMLVETAYISNPADERRLGSGAAQQQLADAIFAGIRGYFEASPPDGTRLALRRRSPGPLVLAGGTGP